MKLHCAIIVFLLGILNGEVQSFEDFGLTTFYSDVFLNLPVYGAVNTVQIPTSIIPSTHAYGGDAPCFFYVTDDIVTNFRVSIFKFITGSFRIAATVTRGRLVYSPYTAWLTMAAIAEGTQGPARKELFKVLSLPEDRCLRQIYYRLATSREYPSNDVILGRRRVLVTDSSVHVNKLWADAAQYHTHLNIASVAFKSNSTKLDNLKRVFKVQLPDINLDGNSLLLESLDYHGLWASPLLGIKIEEGPFYNSEGEEIGTVEYMKQTRQVKIGYATSAKLKAIEIPVGRDDRFKMFFAMTYDSNKPLDFKGFQDDLVFEVLSNLKPTPGPIPIVVPRLSLSSEVDLRKVFEEMGAKKVWTDPEATRNISTPAALPNTFTQRVTISLDNNAVRPLEDNTPPWQNLFTEYADDSDILKDFIGNRPLLIGLYDVETYTLLFAAVYSGPE